jgi:site-specific recombinase XerC
MDSLIDRYVLAMERRALSPATIYKTRRSLLLVDNELGIRAVTGERLETWLDGRGLTPRTRYWWLSMLTCFYSWGVQQGALEVNPCAQIVRPRLRRNLPRPVSEADLDVALALAGPQMRAWLTLAGFAGLRVSEIARLERHHIHDETDPPMLRVLGKGGHERLIPMHPRVWETLRTHGLPRRGRVFTSPNGCGYSPARVSRRIAEYLTDVGLELTAHQFRHRFATRCYQRSKDLRAVQELLGHASPTTTAIYTAWSPAVAADAVMGL